MINIGDMNKKIEIYGLASKKMILDKKSEKKK